MISNKLFVPLLHLALALILMQLASGIWLFIEKYGFSVHDVFTYFAGDENSFIPAKSFEGLMETTVPHFVAVSTTIFVYAHFLLFTTVISEKKKKLIIYSLFISALINIFSSFGIIQGHELFAWIKVFAFWSFQTFMGVLLCILFLAVLREEEA